MWYNYLLVAWRNLIRQPFYSFINILGLSIGITCFLLITLFVRHELSMTAITPRQTASTGCSLTARWVTQTPGFPTRALLLPRP